MTLEESLELAARQTARDMVVIGVVSFVIGAGLATLIGALA